MTLPECTLTSAETQPAMDHRSINKSKRDPDLCLLFPSASSFMSEYLYVPPVIRRLCSDNGRMSAFTVSQSGQDQIFKAQNQIMHILIIPRHKIKAPESETKTHIWCHQTPSPGRHIRGDQNQAWFFRQLKLWLLGNKTLKWHQRLQRHSKLISSRLSLISPPISSGRSSVPDCGVMEFPSDAEETSHSESHAWRPDWLQTVQYCPR